MTKFLLWAAAIGIVIFGSGVMGLASASSLVNLHGDVDCNQSVNLDDALDIVRAYAGLEYSREVGCPLIGVSVPQGTSGLSRESPVPFGDGLVTPEGWEIKLTGFIPNATQMVLDENQFNDPPQAGHRFTIVRLRMTNVSAGNPGDPDAGYAIRMVGSASVGYSTFGNSCGVIPDDIDNKSSDVFPGGSVEGNLCWETQEGEHSFVLYTEFFLNEDEDVRWFDVD